MSGSEFVEGGYDLDEGIRIAQMIEPYVDLIHVSAGTYQKTFGITHPSMFTDHGRNVFLAAEIKKHVSKPVATIGGLNDPSQMEEIIASGKADVVYMARALLADPFLPGKIMANRDEDIVRCLRCFTCMAERAATSTRRCTVNPLIGRECEGDAAYPASVKKKVLVAGGGPGGLYAAYTAARRGHQAILCEKENALGGILKSEQALPFKYEMYQLAGTYAKFCRDAGVEIRLNTEVNREYVEKEAPDALIIAVGSKPLVPPIPGLDGENVVVVNNYYVLSVPKTYKYVNALDNAGRRFVGHFIHQTMSDGTPQSVMAQVDEMTQLEGSQEGRLADAMEELAKKPTTQNNYGDMVETKTVIPRVENFQPQIQNQNVGMPMPPTGTTEQKRINE
jgi:hypothetical protein